MVDGLNSGGKKSAYPFNAYAENRYSYLYNKDPNFNVPKSSVKIEERDIKIQGHLPAELVKQVPEYSHARVRKAMGQVTDQNLREESEILQTNPKSSFNTKSNLQSFSPLKTKFVFVQPRSLE